MLANYSTLIPIVSSPPSGGNLDGGGGGGGGGVATAPTPSRKIDKFSEMLT